MNNINFTNISELQEYITETMKLSSENLFLKYLSKIYSNLLQREDHINNTKAKRFSRDQNSLLFLQKDLSVNNLVPDKPSHNEMNLSLNIFLDYMEIQEFIGQRIYKFLNKNKKSDKLNKNDFCEGLNNLYYGNINELINFTFSLADFNNNGKIYKSDMKLILAYIPYPSEFSQKNYLKQIKKIINNFFDDKLNKDEILYEENEQQINLEIFRKYIEEYNNTNKNKEKQNDENPEFSYDYDNNAPFFYFISIISYIFKNLPFNIKTIEFFGNKKNNIKKIKSSIIALDRQGTETMRIKKLLSTESKGIMKNIFTAKNNSFFKSSVLATSNRYSGNMNNNIKDALPKIGRTNLFSIKKSGSQVLLKKEAEERIEKAIFNVNINKTKTLRMKNTSRSINSKHDFIISKKKDLSDKDLPTVKRSNVKGNTFKSSSVFRHTNKPQKKRVSPTNHDNISETTTKNTSLLFLSKSNSNDIKSKCFNIRKKLPSIVIKQKNYSPVIGMESTLKLKEELKNDIEEPEEFMLCECSDNDDDNRNNICDRESNKANNIFQLNESYLYKYEDNEIYPSNLNKYYALIKEKEILFFHSEQKIELVDIWYINKSYISTGKETILKKDYYTINITYENNFIKKLYFLNESICQSFSLSIKNAINFNNFNDYYELMNSVGEGHFGKVSKCKNKKTGEYYAVKIINKIKLKQNDLELIRQEKNILKLIKHENIIELKDFFEDKQYIYFITEFYEGGDLLTYLEEKQKIGEQISEKTCAKIIRKIAQGIQYLNLFGIVHRDLKPENIMFARHYNFKTIKLIDLGVCKTLTFGEKAKEPIGTNGYIPPEIYTHSEYSFKTDIWSLGIILYLLITGGILPFDDENLDNKVLAKKVVYLQQEYPHEYFGNKSKRVMTLLDKMLEKSENKRMSINSLMKDSWFDIIKK